MDYRDATSEDHPKIRDEIPRIMQALGDACCTDS